MVSFASGRGVGVTFGAVLFELFGFRTASDCFICTYAAVVVFDLVRCGLVVGRGLVGRGFGEKKMDKEERRRLLGRHGREEEEEEKIDPFLLYQ